MMTVVEEPLRIVKKMTFLQKNAESLDAVWDTVLGEFKKMTFLHANTGRSGQRVWFFDYPTLHLISVLSI